MKTLKWLYAFLSVVMLFTLSCKKTEENPQEEEEVNVVKWKQNGVWYQSEDQVWSFMPGGWGVSYRIYEDSSMWFKGKDNPDYKQIKIRIQDTMFKEGLIEMGQGHYDFDFVPGSYAMYSQQEDYWWVDYYTRPGSGWVEIEWISEDKRKFKGRFEMTLYNEEGGSVTLTDGYFNIDMDKLDEEHNH